LAVQEYDESKRVAGFETEVLWDNLREIFNKLKGLLKRVEIMK
jgi:hypothetical protein